MISPNNTTRVGKRFIYPTHIVNHISFFGKLTNTGEFEGEGELAFGRGKDEREGTSKSDNNSSLQHK